MRIWSHPSRDLARMHAFTRAVLGDHARQQRMMKACFGIPKVTLGDAKAGLPCFN